MTDDAMQAAADPVQPSQIIPDAATHENPQAGKLPEAEAPKEQKPVSTRDAIAKAFDEADAKSKAEATDKGKQAAEDAKAKADAAIKDDKAKEPEKAEKPRSDDGKFAKAEKDEPDAKAEKSAAEKPAAERGAPEDNRQSEGRKHSEPPARFLPEARTKWANVPNEVKAEFHRVSQEYEAEVTKHKQSAERYEPLRQFDEIARTNGRELKDSLAKVVEIEQAIARNPIAGLDAVLREIGPRKADGTPVSLYEVAAHIVQQGPQAYQQSVAQAMPQHQATQRQDNPEIAQLRAELQSMRAEQTVVPVVNKFASEHPDFEALAPQIKTILDKGVIDEIYGTGLSLEQKLTEAYRMAGGSLPSRSEPLAAAPEHSEATMARPVDPDGQKSIKGAPTSGQTGDPKWRPKSNREALERAFASAR